MTIPIAAVQGRRRGIANMTIPIAAVQGRRRRAASFNATFSRIAGTRAALGGRQTELELGPVLGPDDIALSPQASAFLRGE
jgi:hypothetical protein